MDFHTYFQTLFYLLKGVSWNPFLADIYTLKGTFLPSFKFVSDIVSEISWLNNEWYFAFIYLEYCTCINVF